MQKSSGKMTNSPYAAALVLAERRDLMRSGALQTAGKIDIIRKNVTINMKNNISQM